MESQTEKRFEVVNETETEEKQVDKIKDNQQQVYSKDSLPSSSSSSSSLSDSEAVCENENLAENLKEALAERERNMQMHDHTEDLSNSEIIGTESQTDIELPPPLPPKTREKKQINRTMQSSSNQINSQISDDDADRVLDFTSD